LVKDIVTDLKVQAGMYLKILNTLIAILDHHLPDGGLVKSLFVRDPSFYPSINNSCYHISSETTGWILTKLGHNDFLVT